MTRDWAARNRGVVFAGGLACAVLFWMQGASPPAAAAEVRAGVAPEDWVLFIEPAFLRAPVARQAQGSEKTLLVAGALLGDDPVRLTPDQFRNLGVAWEAFLLRASQNASRVLEELRPELIRDADRVITHAVIRSENPLTAGVVFAPEFVGHFEEVFGREILVAVPNRNTVFVFPKLAGPHAGFGERVLFEYKNSAYPCSLEVFEISPEGVRAVGAYEE